MPLRKLHQNVLSARKPKFAEKETKWELKRQRRTKRRIQFRKKPLAEPLIIAPVKERQEALKQGKMVFYNGKERIELPLVSLAEERLSGVYSANGRIIAARFFTLGGKSQFRIYELSQGIERAMPALGNWQNVWSAFFSANPDLAHMILPIGLRKTSLALKIVSKADRHVRAKHEGYNSIPNTSNESFNRLFRRLKYRPNSQVPFLEKQGKSNPKDNLDNNFRIEAIDPKTGKAKMFTFPIE